MPSRTITIDIKTQANLKPIDALAKKLNSLTTSLKNLSSASSSTGNTTRALNNLAKSLNTLAAAQKAATQSTQASTKATAASGTAATKAAASVANYSRQATIASRALGTGTKGIAGQYDRLDDVLNNASRASREFTAAQSQLSRIIRTGNTDATKRQQLLETMNQAYSRSKAVQLSLLGVERQRQQQAVQLAQAFRQTVAEQRRVEQALQDTNARMGAAGLKPEDLAALAQQATNLQQKLSSLRQEEQQLLFATREFDKVTQQVNTSLAKNNQIILQAQSGRLQITKYYDQMSKSSERLQRAAGLLGRALHVQSTTVLSALRLLNAGMNATFAILTKLQQAFRTIAGVLSTAFRAGLNSATTMFNTLGRTVGTIGSGVTRALNGMTAGVRSFATAVQHHMMAATRSMQQFYNAGWSLLTTGYMARGAGMGMLGSMGTMLEQFMEYEKILTRSAIAGSNIGQGVAPDPRGLEQQIFDLQYGQRINGERVGAVKAFGANEIAEAMYFYSSAIGEAVTSANIDVVRTILQMAAVTRTQVETATKGVLNIATEFGLDPRSDDAGMQKRISNIAAQLGYLANISTMEVPDIAETFKMLGPMAHILSDRNVPGAGLEEMMMLTFLASEVGLRGGNVGRGIGQALTTLLDPTQPAIEAAAEAFGFEASAEAFKSFFFNAKGQLKEGLPGLFEDIAALDPNKQAQALAAIFTQNATRATIGIAAAAMGDALEDKGGMAGIIKDLQGQNPMAWLESAAETTNQTMFAAWQDLRNAWFATTTSIVRSIEGSLIPAFDAIAEIFWRISDIITSNPWIGQLLGGIIAITSAVLAAVGTLFMLGGSLLLVMKAFALLGGLLGPAVFFFTSMISALLILGPLFVGIAAAAVLVRRAWETNFMGIQDRFHDLIDAAREWAVWASINGPDAARAFATVFEDRIVGQFQRFQRLLAENDMYVNLALRSLTQFASGVQAGFVGALALAADAVRRLGEAVNNLFDDFLPTRGPFEEFEERFNNLVDVSDRLAQALGIGLGAAIAGLILRQFVPAIAITGAFRVALLALRATTFLVAASFAALGAAVSAIGAIMGFLTGASTGFLGLTAAAAAAAIPLALVGAAFIAVVRSSSEVRDQILQIASAIWTGLQPAFQTIGIIAVASFGILKGIIAAFIEELAKNEEGVKRLATAIGITLVVSVGALVAAIVLAVGAIGLLAVALTNALQVDSPLGEFLDSVATDMQEFISLISMENLDIGALEGLIAGRMTQISLIMTKHFTQAFVTGLSAIPKGLNTAFKVMTGVDILQEVDLDLDAFNREIGEKFDAATSLVDMFTDSIIMPPADTSRLRDNLEKALNPFGDPVLQKNVSQSWRDSLDQLLSGEFSAGDIVSMITEKLGAGGNVADALDSILGAFGMNVADSEYGKLLEELTSVTADTSDDLLSEYAKQEDAYEQWLKAIAVYGEEGAAIMYEKMGKPIPASPGTYDEWLADQKSQLDMTSEELQAAVKQLNTDLYAALSGVDLGGALRGMAGGEFTLGQAALLNADTIIQNAGSPEWLNNTELLADIAGMGFLSDAIGGINAHEALGPALQRLSEETGVAVSDLLKDIPKYIVPAEFVPLATAELLKGLEMIGPAAYDRLDDMGLEWAELVDYGIGQALEGHDWNLGDYLQSSMQISEAEAQRILKESLVNPFSITSDIFDDVQLMADMQGGAVSVLTEEWYGWLMEATQNGADKTLEVTRAAFEQLPDAVKIGFSQMGYTWVIGAEGAVADIVRSSEMMKEGLQRGFGAIYTDTGEWADEATQKDFWNRIWDDAAANGKIDRMGMVVEEFEQNGERFVTIRDELSGVEITIPAIQYEAALESARNAAKVADELKTVREEIILWKNLSREKPGLLGADIPFISNIMNSDVESKLDELRKARNELLGITDEGTMQLPDIAPPKNMQVLETGVTNAVTTGFTKAMTSMATSLTVPAEFLTAFDAAFTTIGINGASKLLEGLSTGMGGGEMVQGGPTGGMMPGAGPFDSIFEGYAASAVLKFKEKVQSTLPTLLSTLGGTEGGGEGGGAQISGPFDGLFQGYGTSAANKFHAAFSLQFGEHLNRSTTAQQESGGGLFDTVFAGYGTSAATAFKTAVDTALAGWTPSLGGGGGAMVESAGGYGPAPTGGGGPFDTTFSGWATSALTAFRTGIEPIGQVGTDAGVLTYTNFSIGIAPIVPNAEAMGAGAARGFGIGIAGMSDSATNAVNAVLGILAGAGDAMWNAGYNAGFNAGDGLVAGLNSQIGAVQTAAAALANAASSATAGALETGSPSKVFIRYGIAAGEGLAIGMESTFIQNENTAKNLAEKIQFSFVPREPEAIGGGKNLNANGQWRLRPGGAGSNGPLHIENVHVTISKDVDVDRAFARFNELTGRRVEMARRGMVPIDDAQAI